MASRTPRNTKQDANAAASARAASTPTADTEGGAPSEPAEVLDSSFERREIPSFSDSREARIAEAAYWRAERRGFLPGHELDDWLEAEREIDEAQSRQRDQ